MKLYRADGLLDLKGVQTKTIVFIGLGSLGSLALSYLPYPWQRIVLIDPDILEEDNVERHLLGLREVDRPKVEGVKRYLADRGIPLASIVTYQDVAQNVLDRHTDANLLVVSIDRLAAKRDINGWCREHNIPALYTGVYPKGTGGHVIVIPNPSEVCYLCADSAMISENSQPVTHDYGVAPVVSDDGELHAVPALRWAIGAIATLTAGMALRILEGGEIKPQIVLQHHEWKGVGEFQETSPFLPSVAHFIATLPKLGLQPHMRLEPIEGGYRLQARQAILSQLITRWNACPMHGSAVALTEV